MPRFEGYNRNPNLPKADYIHAFTQQEIDEYVKCASDPVYFTKKYMKIIHVDKGLVPFDMWNFQEDMIRTFHSNRFSICKLPRQVGKCVFKETYIVVRDRKTGLEYNTTIGNLYEIAKNQNESINRRDEQEVRRVDSRNRLCDMHTLRHEKSRVVFSCDANTQDSQRELYGQFPLQISQTRNVSESSGQEQSSISTWWEVFSFFREVSQRNFERSKNQGESEKKQTTSQERYNKVGILVGKNSWKRIARPRNVITKAIDVLARKMHTKVWKTVGSRDLVTTSGKMARNSEIETFGRNYENQRTESVEQWFNIKSRKANLQHFERSFSFFDEATSNIDGRQKDFSLRHLFRKKDYRISRRLLARQPKEIFKELLSSSFENVGRRHTQKRSQQDHCSKIFWIRSFGNMGSRLQSKFPKLHTNLSKLSDGVERKFIDSIDLQDFEIQTDTGWQPVSSIHKTVLYDEWILKTSNYNLICADTHIVFRENHEEVFVQDLVAGDRIITESGIETVVSIVKTDRQSHMFDITVDSDDHRFYTNGILSHNTTTSVAFILHSILFNENYNVAILANKAATAREIVGRLQLAYEHLPRFLQQGVGEWNKGNIALANGSKVQADSTSGSSVRGRSYSMIFLDEFAHVPNNIAEAFFMSTYPTISSGNTTKVIIVSTPNGLNLFYRMWTEATEKRNDYIPIEIHWSMVPGRDEEWKELTIRNTSEEQFDQEFNCNFVGSTNTLIHPVKLRSLVWHTPVKIEGSLRIYKEPEPGRTYCMTVDVAEGQGLDYSTFSIIDVTEIPYRVVATYRNNKIAPMLFPTIIVQTAMLYNEAFVLVEINSIGLQVSDIIHFELAYENLIKIEMKGKQGQQQTPGFKKKIAYGLKTSNQTKIIGCTNLKTLIESDKLIVNDEQTINELMTFSADKKTFKAEQGNNDDLAMTLVHFGWLSAQKYFRENINTDIRKVLQQEQLNLMDQDITPFGIIDNGIDNPAERDAAGDLWIEDRQKFYPFDDFNWKPRL